MTSSKLTIFLTVVVYLSACAPLSGLHNPSHLPDDQLAFLDRQKLGSQYHPFIVAIYDPAGTQVIGKWSIFGYDQLETAKLAPGRYRIKVQCTNSHSSAFPEIDYEFLHAERYLLFCIEYNEKGFLGVNQTRELSAEIHRASAFDEEEFLRSRERKYEK